VCRPHLFHERKRELADAVAGLAQMRPCRCDAHSMSKGLMAAQLECEAAKSEALQWRDLAASLRTRRSRPKPTDPFQMMLPLCDLPPRCTGGALPVN
jgi:hypothetical protein